jgi:hypothetical protein
MTTTGILGKIKGFFGREAEQTAAKVRQEIMERLEPEIRIEDGRRVFPFRKLTIILYPSSKSVGSEFRRNFIDDCSLAGDMRHALGEMQAQTAPDLDISIELREAGASTGAQPGPSSLFEMIFLESFEPSDYVIPEITLKVLKGTAEKPVYCTSKDRLLIGCLDEVTDREGRLVRRNNVVFPGGGSEINATVGSMHARIWFDFSRRQFRIMDESSRYGTRIVREGRTIEVPADNPRGVGLRTGDEIYVGQACLRFELPPETGSSYG